MYVYVGCARGRGSFIASYTMTSSPCNSMSLCRNAPKIKSLMASPEEFPSLDDLLSRHGLVRQDLENKYPAEMRLEIAQLLDDWKMIGYYLGFASQKVNDIKVDNDNEEQRRVALLDAWEQREGEGATYFKLAEVLHHRGRVDLVENLCRMIRRVREEMNVLLLDQSTSTAGINSCKTIVIIALL